MTAFPPAVAENKAYWARVAQAEADRQEAARRRGEEKAREDQERAARLAEVEAKARAEWVARRNVLADELKAAQGARGTALGLIELARKGSDIDAAVTACCELVGAERLMSIVEADVAAHKRAEPGRMY
jgi:hypothetical protein